VVARNSLDTPRVTQPAATIDDTAKSNTTNPATFYQRIQQLDSWQTPLLRHLTHYQPEQRLHEEITNTRDVSIELASDGGARDDLGSFGWTIAYNKTTLWKCKGPTFGLSPGSFRAESYGMISALLFLRTYLIHYETQHDHNKDMRFYCDGSYLLKRIEITQTRSWHNPTACLASDYDLESGIVELLNELPIKFQFIHVKCHQDKDTEIHLLPWEAQMNVQADHLATDYLDNYAEPSKIIPFIPTVQANITIKGETITRRFANRLRLTANSPDMRNRLITRNNWTEHIFQSIHWDTPGKALATLEHSTRIFITKFAHEHLPTRRHMKRIGEAESDQCPSCRNTTETSWHILNCANRTEWCNTLHKHLSDVLYVNKTQPDLAIILMQGVREAIKYPNYQMEESNREHRFTILVQAQNLIGWNHILKGRFSHHWIQCQQAHIYLDPDTDSKKQSGEIWLKRILNCMWTNLWQVWLIRNDDLHGRDRQQREKKCIEKLTPRIVALYDKADTVLAADKDIFAIPIDTQLTFPSGELKAWITLATPTIKRAINDANEHHRRTNHTITQHLTARPDPLTRNDQVNELRPIPRMTKGSKT
jgi:hypothetical protein